MKRSIDFKKNRELLRTVLLTRWQIVKLVKRHRQNNSYVYFEGLNIFLIRALKRRSKLSKSAKLFP